MPHLLSFLMAALVLMPQLFAQPTTPFARIEGDVTDLAGTPLRKAALTLRSYGENPPKTSYSATSDSKGGYLFDVVEPGVYTLTAERAGYLPKVYRARPQETMTQLTLAARQHLTGIDLAMTRVAVISGTVLDEDGDPVAAISVCLLRSGYMEGRRRLLVDRSVSTNDSGKYQMEIPGSGAYYLTAGVVGDPVFLVAGMRAVGGFQMSPQMKTGTSRAYYAATFYPGSIDESGAGLVKVQAGSDRPGIDIHLRKTAAFRVKGRVEEIAPKYSTDQCRVALLSEVRPEMPFGPSGWERTTFGLGKDGSFDSPGLLFSPGAYRFTVSCSSKAGRGTVVARERLVIDKQDIDNAVIRIRPLLTLNGLVTIEGGKGTEFRLPRDSGIPAGTAPPQISLSADDRSPLNTVRATVKDDGSFAITEIAAGEYNVRLFNIRPGTYLKSVQLGPGNGRRTAIELNEANAGNPLQIIVSQSSGHIEGEVKTESGLPARRSTVTLVSDLPENENGATMMSGVDGNAHFTLSPVAPGTYRLFAWEDLEVAQHYDPEFLKPYLSKSLRVTVDENGTARVTLTEIPAGPAFQNR